MNWAIKIENLSKQYQVVGNDRSGNNLREELGKVAKRFFLSSLNKLTNKKDGEPVIRPVKKAPFWALKDINLEIKEGEVLGIIGRNGAGKSTLLKILSRITPPTSGRVQYRGRMASLLEVGTGFHRELSGRENIYLNGCILGMHRSEVTKKLDEIVSFAEINQFLDTPVKYYSSGMHVRLAFAVAAHLEADILVLDEVLAVGDAQFQQKCLGKMGEVSQRGKTVLIVSHNLPVIQSLCSKAIYLKHGTIGCFSNAAEAAAMYISDSVIISTQRNLKDRTDRKGSGRVQIVSFYAVDERLQILQTLSSGMNFSFVIEYHCSKGTPDLNSMIASIALTDESGRVIWLVRSNYSLDNLKIFSGGGKIYCEINDFNLAEGQYNVSLFLSYSEAEVLDWIDDATQIRVVGGDYFKTGVTGHPEICKTMTRSKWSFKK